MRAVASGLFVHHYTTVSSGAQTSTIVGNVVTSVQLANNVINWILIYFYLD